MRKMPWSTDLTFLEDFFDTLIIMDGVIIHIGCSWNFKSLIDTGRWCNTTVGSIIWKHEQYFLTFLHNYLFSPKIYIYPSDHQEKPSDVCSLATIQDIHRTIWRSMPSPRRNNFTARIQIWLASSKTRT